MLSINVDTSEPGERRHVFVYSDSTRFDPYHGTCGQDREHRIW